MHRRGFLRSLLAAPVALYAALSAPKPLPRLQFHPNYFESVYDPVSGVSMRFVRQWTPHKQMPTHLDVLLGLPDQTPRTF